MKIEPTYVTFEQAKLLKEKGFDELCSKMYKAQCIWGFSFMGYRNSQIPIKSSDASAPEQWQVVEFLRINHGIWVFPEWQCGRKNWIFNIEKLNSHYETIEIQKNYYRELGEEEYNSPQEAYSAAFDYILKHLI